MSAGPLFTRSMRNWLGARGFAMVAFAAVLPLILTGAWVGSHQADLTVASFTADRPDIQFGDTVNFTAVFRNDGRLGTGAFNASIGVFGLAGGAFVADATSGGARTSERLEGLGPGETGTLTLTWRASPGVYLLLASVDKPTGAREETGDVQEIEELNNFKIIRSPATQSGVWVVGPPASVGSGPNRPTDLGGNASAANSTDAVVTLATLPSTLTSSGRMAVNATIRNDGATNITSGTFRLQGGTVSNGTMATLPTGNRQVTFTAFDPLAPGATRNLTFTWNHNQAGVFWFQAYFQPGSALRDTDTDNSWTAQAVTVSPTIPENVDTSIKTFLEPYETIPEKATIKSFYLTLLSLLHLRVLVPFIALFYAAGVLADDRERGNLVFMLTRPVERWQIPLMRFAASFLVAGLALAIGLVGTYALLFGSVPAAQDIGFLVTPLLASLLALFAYGAFFTLLGVLVDRPYLVGVAIVIGWETLASSFVEWVGNITLSGHLATALTDWKLDEGLQWLPATEAGVKAVQIIAGAAVVFLVAAAVMMRRREFEV